MAARSVCLLAIAIWAGIGTRSARSGRTGASAAAAVRALARSEAEAVALHAADRRHNRKPERQTNIGLGPEAQAIHIHQQRRRRFNFDSPLRSRKWDFGKPGEAGRNRDPRTAPSVTGRWVLTRYLLGQCSVSARPCTALTRAGRVVRRFTHRHLVTRVYCRASTVVDNRPPGRPLKVRD